MFWLRNELFGFPVNDCDYEGISCERSYIPVLNRDKENEFTWSLADPYGTDIDANNVSFNTKTAVWPSDINSVAKALEELMRRVNESNKCKFDITGFTLLPDEQGNVVGTISYNDTKGNPHTVEASFNLQDTIEGMDLNLSDLTVDNLTVNTRLDSLGETATHGLENDGDFTNSGDIENMGKITTEDFETNTATVNTKLESKGETVTNGIENDGDITNTGEVATNSLVSETGTIGDLNSDRVVVSTTLESIGETFTRGIENTGKITTDDIETDTATVNTKLESLGDTVTNGIENTGTIETETLVVDGNSEFGGDVKIDGKTTTNDVEIDGTLDVSGKTTTNGIENNGNIKNNGLLETTDAKVDNNLIVDWHTDVNTLEVNGAANFREPVNVYDDFYVSGDYTLNGEGKFNGPETHNGNVVYNGDLTINGTLSADDVDIDIDLEDYQKKEDKGRNNGYASLDDQGKVPMSQLPNIAGGISYKGGWNAGTGVYPSNPSNGDMYYCTNGGTVNGTVYNVGDRIIYDSDTASWNVLPDNYGVQSVNGRTGIVVDVQDTTDRKNAIDLVNPATNKYLSEKAVADLINPLIARIEELEEEQAKSTVATLDGTSGMPATMTEGTEYTIPFAGMTASDHVIILDTDTAGNVVITPGAGFLKIVSSANETNPVVNIMVIK